MGFPLYAARRTDDVQLYADRQRKTDAPLQALYASICGKQTECDLLQPTM